MLAKASLGSLPPPTAPGRFFGFAGRRSVVGMAVRRGQPVMPPARQASVLAALPAEQQADGPPPAAQGDKRVRNSWLSWQNPLFSWMSQPASWQFRLLYGGLALSIAASNYSAASPVSAVLASMYVVLALYFFFSPIPRTRGTP